MKYEYGTNKIETYIEQKINLTDKLIDLPKINNNNAIKINDLDKEATKELVNRIKIALNQKIDTTFVNNEREDFVSILKVLGIKRDIQEIQPIGVTDAERDRYNSQFDILQGENLKGKDIITAINAIKGNINKIDIISDTELKIKLVKLKSNSNDDVVKQLIEFLEKNSDKVYNIKIDYDENGLAQQIQNNVDYKTFFENAPCINPNHTMVKGTICGIRVENIEDPIIKLTRCLDKMIDELAKGKTMEKILRK